MLCATMLMRVSPGWAATRARTSSARRQPQVSMPSYVANLGTGARQTGQQSAEGCPYTAAMNSSRMFCVLQLPHMFATREGNSSSL
jgi:hypothetical protein